MLDVMSKEEISAGQFLPIAEKYQLGFEIDRLLIHRLSIEELAGPVAINLSASTIGSEEKQRAYLDLLASFTDEKRRLISFEINESVAFANRKLISSFITELASLGFTVGLDRVGCNFSSFYYLSSLQISYLKLDGSLTKNSDDSASQLFLKNLVKSAETLDILVIATNIETKEQMETLSQLGIFCGQGLYLSKLKRVF